LKRKHASQGFLAWGGLLNARKVALTLSHKINEISDGQGLSASISKVLLVMYVSQWSMSVSITLVSVGSLFGVGILVVMRTKERLELFCFLGY